MLWIECIVKGIMLCWLLVLSCYDIKIRKIPMWGLAVLGVISISGAIINILSHMSSKGLRSLIISLGLGVIPGLFLLFLVFATKKIGIADGLIMCCIGLIENYVSCVIIFCFASFGIAIISIVLLALKRVKRSTELPFVPLITVGFLVKQILFFLYI